MSLLLIMLKKIIREPLVHFLVVSASFFLVYNMLNPIVSDMQTIYISEGRIAQIKNSFAAQWKRQPLANELDDAVNSFSINQMYLLEAKSLSLDIGDSVINRRLRQKMTFLLNDLAASKEPSEDELLAFYLKNSDKYRAPAQYGFKQIFISSDRAESDVQSLLALQLQRIQQGLSPEGDHSLLPSEVKLANDTQLDRDFGKNFSLALVSIDLDQWSGPIQSAFGQHFIFLETRKAAQMKPIEEVRASVVDDWQYQNAKNYQQQYEQKLLETYQIDVQKHQINEPAP
ncbi:MAG: parvulin-like peptidyl-prolyl isomerase [Oceanicoccus sp.]|jgi:parvulin-like peptidyl-prolyl isomerase